MKNTIFIIAVAALIAGASFAGDTDYKEFRITETTPSGDPILMWNCDWDSDAGFQMFVDLYLETPFEENMDVEIYVYNPNEGSWSAYQTCTNVDSGGKHCRVYFPVYWGMSENNTDGYASLLKAELDNGGDIYSKTFTFHISHKRTAREEVVYAKIGEFESLLAGMCPQQQSQFSEVVSRTMELGRECRIDEAREEITSAINEAKALDPSDCTGGEEPEVAPPETEPSDAQRPPSLLPGENASVRPPGGGDDGGDAMPPSGDSETGEEGGICAGFALAGTALAGALFCRRRK